jgi:hypothetical protein
VAMVAEAATEWRSGMLRSAVYGFFIAAANGTVLVLCGMALLQLFTRCYVCRVVAPYIIVLKRSESGVRIVYVSIRLLVYTDIIIVFCVFI